MWQEIAIVIQEPQEGSQLLDVLWYSGAFTMAAIFSGVARIPSASTLCPKYSTESSAFAFLHANSMSLCPLECFL